MARSFVKVASVFVVLAGVVGTARLAMGTHSPPPLGNAIPETHEVRVGPVEHGVIDHPIFAAGLLHSKKEFDLSFLMGGEVTWVGVDVGAKVKRGQLLARLDTTAIAADADRARAAKEKAVRDLGRVQTLAKTGSLPQNDLDDATTGSHIAEASLRSADFALRHGVLVAPEDGVIDARAADPHEVVSPGQPVLRMSGKSQGVVVRVGLVDRDVLDLALGAPAHVTIDARPGTTFDATVTQIASAASPLTGTFEVELRLEGATDGLGNGLSAKVEIARKVNAASIVPVAALVDGDGNKAFVFVVDQGVVKRQAVHVAFFEGDRASLVEPLTAQARVATIGAGSLVDGDRVREAP